jgi:dienelactone hydrolase
MKNPPNPTAELVAVHTSDNLELPGLLYSPARPAKKAALWIHGNGDGAVFYNVEHVNALGAALTARGIALLALNNRGAHYSKTIKLIDEVSLAEHKRYQGGVRYELIKDCVKDIDAAASFLNGRGYTDLAIIGESTGANKICVYDAHASRKRFNAYVLAGPGDDSGIYYAELGEKKFWKTVDYAGRAIKAGKPMKLLPGYTGLPGWSAQSAYDMLQPDEPYTTFPYYEATNGRLGKKPLFEEYGKITKQMLVIFGSEDEFAFTAGGVEGALALLREHTDPRARKLSTFTSIEGADHGFREHDELYAETVAEWLTAN